MKSSRLRATALTAALSTAILLALFLSACDKDRPNGPTPLPLTPRVVRLELTGPASLPPGGAEQFRATAHFSDGSQRDVTTEAAWTSANSSIVSVSTSGLATGRDRGETDIRAAFSQVISTKRVIVLPPGTFKLSGRVLDDGVGVTDARVEVTAGLAAGLSTVSQDGNYALYGVSGQTQVRVTKDGYHPRVNSVSVTDHRTFDFHLALLAPPWDPSGTYTLTITAAPECRTALPEDAWVRTYRAVLTLLSSNARYVNVNLEGAAVVNLNSWFWSGRIGESSVSFDGAYYSGPPVVVERLASSRFFFVDADAVYWPKAVVSRTPAGLDGPFQGTLAIGEGEVWSHASLTAQCSSRNHRFTFSR
jgi:hypothetical protein